MSSRTEMHRVIRSNGQFDRKLEPHLSNDYLKQIYRWMLLIRKLSERCLLLQRQGRIGFCVDSSGHEACQVGAASALTPKDWLFPYYRDAGMCLIKGITLSVLVNHIMANADDAAYGRQLPVHWTSREHNIVSSSSFVANRLSHAVGVGYAIKYKNDDRACLTSFGEGSTSQGEFHAALNFAGVWKVPVVFLCENNQYAISLPARYQTASESIAIKAEAYGFEGVQVDGTDVLAVYAATKRALEKARSGGGPTLIEALTYRLGGHSSSDDPAKYRNKEESDYWKRRDPIPLFLEYLKEKDIITTEEASKMEQSVESELLIAFRAGEQVPKPSLATMFRDVYSEMPWHIEEELHEALGE